MIPDDLTRATPGFHIVPPGHLAAVVTALEMRAPPRAAPAPERDDARLRRLRRPSLERYRALFRRVGEPWFWVSRLVMPDVELRRILADPKIEIFALESNGPSEADPIGLLELSFAKPGECEIAFLGLAPGHTGRGLGRLVMTQALARAWAEPGMGRVWVHTCTLDDPAALPFYLRSGFTPYARYVEILPDPRLTGLFPAESPGNWPLLPD